MPNPATLIEPGRKAPAFHLADQEGTKHRLSHFLGQWVVLYFYPKDDTPGCTTEACDFNDRLDALTDADAVVLGVSPQGVASKEKFAAKHGLTFPLLADEGHTVCEKYGTWQEKNLYGKKSMGVVRTTYLIDPKGKVAQRWDRVRTKGHAAAVLEALQHHSTE